MKINCTIEEFADLVRGCHATYESNNCPRCALYRLCYENGGKITQYVTAETITKEDAHEQ